MDSLKESNLHCTVEMKCTRSWDTGDREGKILLATPRLGDHADAKVERSKSRYVRAAFMKDFFPGLFGIKRSGKHKRGGFENVFCMF